MWTPLSQSSASLSQRIAVEPRLSSAVAPKASFKEGHLPLPFMPNIIGDPSSQLRVMHTTYPMSPIEVKVGRHKESGKKHKGGFREALRTGSRQLQSRELLTTRFQLGPAFTRPVSGAT